MEGQDHPNQIGQHAFRADDGSQSDLQPPQKRQRVSQACGPCRDRKTRCDGRQPICRACETRRVSKTCNFDYVRRQRQSRTSGVSTGSNGQEAQAQPGGTFRSDISDPQSLARNHVAQALSDLAQSKQDHAPLPPVTSPSTFRPLDATTSANPGQYHPAWRAPARADGLATLADGNDNSLYGPSSTVAFLRHVMPSHSRTATPADPTGVKPRTSAPVPDRHLPRINGLAVLPRRREADNFLLCYWEFIHSLFPVLHKPTFLRRYDSLWTDSDNDKNKNHESEFEDATFTSTLNLVFAIGCKFSNMIEATQKSPVAEHFFQRSRQSYAFDILDSTSISVVQMLVLTGVYLQSTQHASRCWNSVGLAIRMSQSLGLHVDHNGRQHMSQVEQQMRRRIWHACIHLDRLLSMTFGRPSMIDKQIDVPVPALIDDDYLVEKGTGVQPAGVPSRLGLFVSSSPLLEILEEILERFYRHSTPYKGQSGSPDTTDFVTPVLDLNRKLDDFAETIPEYLHVSNNSSTPGRTADHVQLQQQVLSNRFLYVRLLSLRPILLAATKQGSRSSTKYSLDDDLIRSCCTRCVTIAGQLVDGIHANIATLYRSSGWHSVYFTFSAAMTLLASWKIDDLLSRLEVDTREATWSRCLAIFEHYENQINSAEHAIKILKSLKAQIFQPVRTQVAVPTQNALPQLDPALRAAATPNTNGTTPATTEMFPALGLDDADFFGTDNISEAWYGQQLINLDWLEIPQLLDSEQLSDAKAPPWAQAGYHIATPSLLPRHLPVLNI